MSTDLVMGSDRAIALQASIQKELSVKGYSPEDDTVMAEYITIMLINDKTPDQVTAELTELIGEYETSFTDWLFAEKSNPALDVPADDTSELTTVLPPPPTTAIGDVPPHMDGQSVPPAGPRHTGPPHRTQGRALHTQALSSLSSGTSSNSSVPKRQRSQSPSGGPPHKRRQADLPDRPRAMRDEPSSAAAAARNGRASLLDRFGPRKDNASTTDHIQERIRSITLQQQPGNNMQHPHMVPGSFPPGMDPATMAMMQQQGFNPAMMQGNFPGGLEATMMAIQQFGQLALQMGLVPGAMGMGPPAGMMQNAPPPGFNGPGRGGPPGAGFQGDRGRRGGPPGVKNAPSRGAPPANAADPTLSAPSIIAPTPVHHSTPAVAVSNIPLRPLSPTLCKFVTNCTNPTCRYSHPSPVATKESGVVLSTEPCEQGIDCLDKDCLKAHVSKAAKNPTSVPAFVASGPVAAQPTASQVPCRFDPHCTRPNCPYYHPSAKYKAKSHFQHAPSTTMCRFGTACTRADCTFSHPPGRVLPGQFSKGLNAAAPTTIAPGSVEKDSRNKSVDFRTKANPSTPKKDLVQQAKQDEGVEATAGAALAMPLSNAVAPVEPVSGV